MTAVPAEPARMSLSGNLASKLLADTHAPVVEVSTADDGSGDLFDLRIGTGSSSVLYFVIPLHPRPATAASDAGDAESPDPLVIIRFKELNSASRCALYISPSDPNPTHESAVWRLVSPSPLKTLVVHPADDNYLGDRLYLAVAYLEGNGCTFANLSVRLRPTFYSVWYRREVRAGCRPLPPSDPSTSCCDSPGASFAEDGPISPVEEGDTTPTICTSLFIGAWRGRHHHGRGVTFYATTPVQSPAGDGNASASGAHPLEGLSVRHHTPAALLLLLQTIHERRCLPWSALSLPDDPTLDGMVLDAAFIAKITGLLDTRDAASPPPEACDVEQHHSAHGGGVALAAASGAANDADEDGWRVIQAPIYTEGIEAYDGDWVNGRKEGHGVYQWSDRVYVGEWQKGQRHGYGELRYRDGSSYRGGWKDDRRHGHGVSVMVAEGSTFWGEWRNGVREGEGRLRYANGTVIRGKWVSDALAEGLDVRATYPDGTKYVGQWLDDCRNGVGSYTDARGCVHEHTWARDQRCGKGVIRLKNGVRFDGAWEGDELLEGVYCFPNGDTYQGDWDSDADVRRGTGRCVSRNEDVYEGGWLGDQRHGVGTMCYAATGAVYHGEWLADKPNGEGRLVDSEGTYEGYFENGRRSGQGTQTSPDGSVYRGSWRNDFRAGHGTQFDAVHNITYTGIFLHDRLQGEGSSVSHAVSEAYSGTWLDGQRQGHGTLRLPSGDIMRGVWHRGRQIDGGVELTMQDGSSFVGEWRDGVRCGHGTQVSSDGATVYEGMWFNDKPHGRGRLTRANGESVDCEWCEGDMVDGTGTLEFLDGSVYVGDVRQGMPHGQGTLTYPDATVFNGTFEDGIYSL